MLKSSLCDYIDAYILVIGKKTITELRAYAVAVEGEKNNGVIFKNCARFTDCIDEINNIQVDNAKDLDVFMPVYKLIEYSNDYSKTSGSSRYY